MSFRDLNVDEIECRISQVKEKGLILLLYKDARCDMKILDETLGFENWQRDHKECKGNLFCGIGIWDEKKSQWVWKWDCGTESYTEKEKGEASDSFKRAGFNWGIGRELYTAPFIYVQGSACEILTDKNGNLKCYDKFEVTHVKIEDKQITELKIANKSRGIECFSWKLDKSTKTNYIEDKKLDIKTATSLYELLISKGWSDEKITKNLQVNFGVQTVNELLFSQYAKMVRALNKEEVK